MSNNKNKGFLWDYKKKVAVKNRNIAVLFLVVGVLILANIRLGIVTMGTDLPYIVILPGMVLLYLISAIVIAVLFGRINDVRKDDLNYNFNGISLLIAEHNFINRDIFTAILSHTGIKMDFAENGEEALSLYKKNQLKYNIVFIDVDIPVISACDLFSAIREIKGNGDESIPLIGVIGQSSKVDIEEYFTSGMDDAIAKPFDPEDVCILIQKRARNIKRNE